MYVCIYMYMVRTCQGLLMERDPSMYHAATNSYCRVRNSALNENLGQVIASPLTLHSGGGVRYCTQGQ